MKTYLQFFIVAALTIPSLAFAQCGGTLSMNVTPPPQHCNGDTVTITANLSGGNAGWSFKIYRDSITPTSKISNTSTAMDTPYVSTTYYATADSSGCLQKLDSITIRIGIAQPLIYIRQGDTLFCTTDSFYTSYQWYLNGFPITGATDTFLVVISCDQYAVLVKDTNGCSALAVFAISCGVESITTGNNVITISPNPFTSSTTLQFSTHLTNAEVIITNILGNEILRKTISGNSMEIDKGRLENGIYFVKVWDDERQWVGKLVVE